MTTASAAKTGNNSQPTNAKVASKRPGANPFLLPPDEQFWQRYSPHYEAPISFLSSGMFHLLLVGLVVGVAILAAIMGLNRSHNVQFQAVKLPGGGGGNPDGVGAAPGIGSGPKEDVNGNTLTDIEPDTMLQDRPPLDPNQIKVAREVFDNDKEAIRFINSGNQNLDAMMKSLNKDVLNKLRDGLQPGKGEGGPGSGGGEGPGHGPSKGPGTGSGKGTLTEREKRMLRWVMVFQTHDPGDYIRQLNGLGAIVAIPTSRDQYSVVEDLNARPAKLVPKDVAALNRIFWVDDKPNSVAGVLRTLGIARTAPHFVAFMPQELEEKLGRQELAYKGLREDEIDETKFEVFKEASGYNVRVTHQTTKRGR